MNYFQLNSAGTKWEKCVFNPFKRTVNLYDDNFVLKGIGLY